MNKTKINRINNQNFIKYLFMGQKIYFEKEQILLIDEKIPIDFNSHYY